MNYDAWLFTGERDEEEEAEIEARRKFYEEQRQEQEDDRNYYDWQWVGSEVGLGLWTGFLRAMPIVIVDGYLVVKTVDR